MRSYLWVLSIFLIFNQAIGMERIVLEYDLCLSADEAGVVSERFCEMQESLRISDGANFAQDFRQIPGVFLGDAVPAIDRISQGFVDRPVPKRSNIELSRAVRTNNLDRVYYLLNCEHADPDEPVYGAMTPLMRAVDEGFYEVAEVLLRAGASPNRVPRNHLTQCTALHYAVNHNNFAMVKLLLKYGAQDLQKDRFNETPLGLARRLNLKEIVDFFYGVS